MKRILFLLFAVGLTANMTVMAGMSTSKVRKETRFLTDKMAYELSLSTCLLYTSFGRRISETGCFGRK